MWYLMLFPDTLTRRRFKSTYTFLTFFCFNSLSIFFFASFFFYMSSYARRRLSVESACVYLFLVFRRIGKYISLDLFCQRHQQLLTHSMKEMFKHNVYCMQICATIWDGRALPPSLSCSKIAQGPAAKPTLEHYCTIT